MKSINNQIVKLVSRIGAVLLALLGFAACEGEVMYGTPTGSFEIKGKVTTEDGAPVDEAVIVVAPLEGGNACDVAKAESDASGNYLITGTGWPDRQKKVVCTPAVDYLEPDSTVIQLKYGGKDTDDWYQGHADATVNFKLKYKEQ